MTGQHASKDAVILDGATPIGEIKDIEWSEKNTAIEEHDMAGGDPTLLEYGDTSYVWKFSKGWVDGAFAAKLIAKTKVSIEIRPEGTGNGKAKITLASCVIEEVGHKAGKNVIILTNVSGRAISETPGTQ